MKIKQALKYIGFLVVTLSLGGIACSNNPIGPSPKFLLTSSNSETNGNYEYYEINGGTEYAVGLTEAAKASTAAINIDSTYNEKPVTGIWRYGFANSRSSSITLPSSLTVIDYEAFMGSSITSITIPGSITQIGEAAFYGCKNITKVSIQNTTGSSETSSACSCDKVIVEDEGEVTPCTLATIPGFCFFNCNNLKELILPQSIEEIGVEAFHNCRSLYTTLAFMSIRNIRSRAFQGCAALKNVYISSSFFTKDTEDKYGEIEDKAFDGCNSSLKFWLVCSTDDVNTWLADHSDNRWRWKNETLNPETSTNLYTYEVTPSGAEYTSDWIFTTINGDVEITSYIGPVEIDDTPVKFLNVPDELPSGSGNKVRTIAIDAFNTVKANLERIYLPTTLRRIEKGMFNGDYKKLIVVDDSTTCTGDKTVSDAGQNVEKRIDLHNITDLEVIANEAFKDMPKLKELTRLHLPYSLKAVGYRAFGSSENTKHLRKVTDFKWDYDDEKSALEVIGGEAFYELGVDNDSASYSNVAKHRGYYKNNNADNPSNPLANKNYLLTELVFPRTFRHFGITSGDEGDNATFNLGGAEGNDEKFGKSAFAGCPLISKVVFRGSLASTVQSATTSTVDNNTQNLVIPTETFVMNESLRTVIFEERCGRNILFHTAGGTFKPAIGWSSGRSSNDFSGDPTLQTIVLPNKFTNLRMQKYAFAGNSRAVIYYSAGKTNKIYGNTTAKCHDAINNITGNSTGIGNVPEWKRIGNEALLSNTYPGYWFADSNKNDLQNRFGIDQYIPENSSIYYKDSVSTSGGDIDVIVGFGNSTEYVVKDKCAFICDSSKNATLTKYLYDRYDRNFTGTARVPAKVTRTLDSKECTVKTIGPSAFSAAYCDSTSYASVSTHLDLTAVEIPNSIVTIREYAFMRAYGVTKLSSYNPSTGNLDGDYVMPSSLTTIGKHAFAFCNIQQFLKIPTNCLFYENNNSDSNTYETSAFTNNFSLRKITFGNDNATSSNYYTTTTYVSNSGDTYTSAIYSTSSAPKNASLLLLVLNRDTGNDRTSSTASSLDCTITAGESDFNGRYAAQYLYGAFKMCYWIDSLTVGTANSNLPQPLISGIYDVANNKDKLVYLNTCNDFTTNKNNNNLKYITFADTDEISTPPYSFEGCGNIIRVKLPQVENGHIPAGLFAAVDNASIIFVVPGDDNCDTWKECAAGELDLTYTKYTHIDAEAFKGTNINVFTAPKVDTFTVEDSAFASCGELLSVDFSNVENEVIVNENAFSNCAKLSTVDFSGTVNNVTLNTDSFANCGALTSVDFSGVTNRVVLNGTFRGSTIKNDLFDFGSNALIEFGEKAFYQCTFPGKKFTFPVKTALIGTSCFEKCSTLEEVTADGNLTNLKRVVVDSETGKNNEGNTTGFKQIGDYAFYQCTNLKKFNFDYFGEIERIGNYAFSMATEDTGKGYVTPTSAIASTAVICTDGIVNLPATITNLGVGAFSGSKIVTVTINSTEIMFERGKTYSNDPRAAGLSNGGHQFRRCTALTTITFTVPNCEWNTKYLLKSQDGQDNYFSECTSLTAIYFTSDYDLQYPLYTGSNNNQRPDSMVWDSNTDLKFYMYTTTSQYDPNGKAISEFWRRMKAGSTAPIVYWAATNADIVKLEDSKYKEIYAGQRYWGIVNGERTFLGMATSINETTGLVTFKISNTVTYYADLTHIYKA